LEFSGVAAAPTIARPNAPKLFKLHGSLNWLYCPTCASITLTPGEKGVIRLIEDFANSACPRCESVYLPIIVPPTYFKDMESVFLNTVWNKCDRAIADADHIIFCGYSFPDADMHIKYLIKRQQVNRRPHSPPLRVTVLNNHPGKTDPDKENEKVRFSRFLGRINYTDNGFQQFAANPEIYFR
jgi:NAD-dependent SIR2 family protein deacetylase